MTSPISPENVTRTQLENGLVVLVKENHSTPVVTLRGRLLAGAVSDATRLAGTAVFTAAALNRGTRRYTFRQLNEELDRYGFSLGVGAGQESVGFAGRSLKEDFGHLLDIAEELLLFPTLPEPEIEKLRAELLADLAESNQDTREVADREFRKLCYPAPHPYHKPVEGTPATVARIQRQDLVQFHAKNYVPPGSAMVVVGDISAAQAVELIECHFAKWKGKNARRQSYPQVPDRAEQLFKHVSLRGKTQSDIVVGYPGIRRSDPEFYSLSVADLIFGRMGLSGRIGSHVRDEQGLAYYVYSSLEAGRGPGPWMVHAGVNVKSVQRALDAIMAEIVKFRDWGVTDEELTEAKDFLTGFLALRLETNDGVASTLMDMEFYNLGLDYIERYPGIIRGVTQEQILEVVQKYARPEAAVTVVAGPAA